MAEKAVEKTADMKQIQGLLNKAAELLSKRQRHPNETGDEFNIFTVLDRERKEESTHCRLIYELLNPEGSHGQGDLFLQEFFRSIIGKPLEGKVTVKREYRFDNGRIDLLLWGDNFCYPIEVKIDAGDQERQIERYLKFAEKQRKGQSDFEAIVYYLTLDKHDPSKKGKGDARSEQVKNISFPCEIRSWLVQCKEKMKSIPNIQIILRQYIWLIDRLKGEIPMEELEKKISKSKISYESAVEIAKTLPSVRAKKMIEIFEKIEDIVKKQINISPIDSSYRDEAQKYYTKIARPDPSLGYLLKEEEKGESSVELWFQVDHDDDVLWYGAVLRKGEVYPKAGKDDILAFQTVFNNDPWKEKIKEIVAEYDWWVWKEKLLDFHVDAGDYSNLFDKAKFKEMMGKIQSELERHLKNIKETGLRK